MLEAQESQTVELSLLFFFLEFKPFIPPKQKYNTLRH